MDQPTVADRVRGALATRRLNQEQAGEAIGLSQKAMSRRLTGEVDFSISELKAIPLLTGVPVAELCGEAVA